MEGLVVDASDLSANIEVSDTESNILISDSNSVPASGQQSLIHSLKTSLTQDASTLQFDIDEEASFDDAEDQRMFEMIKRRMKTETIIEESSTATEDVENDILIGESCSVTSTSESVAVPKVQGPSVRIKRSASCCIIL